MIKIKKIVVWLTAGTIMLGIGILTSKLFQYFKPSLQVEYENTDLFRSMSDPIMMLCFIQPFALAFMLAWIWNLLKKVIKGVTSFQKGVNFGFIYWVITLPGLMFTFAFFSVSINLTLTWSVSIFFQGMAAGMLFSRMIP